MASQEKKVGPVVAAAAEVIKSAEGQGEGSSESAQQKLAELKESLTEIHSEIALAEETLKFMQDDETEENEDDLNQIDSLFAELQVNEKRRDALLAEIKSLEANLAEADVIALEDADFAPANEVVEGKLVVPEVKNEPEVIPVVRMTAEQLKSMEDACLEIRREITHQFDGLEQASNPAIRNLAPERSSATNEQLPLEHRVWQLDEAHKGNWTNAYLSGYEKRATDELDDLERQRDKPLEAAIAERIKNEKPPELLAIDAFFDKWAKEYRNDGSRDSIVKESLFMRDEDIRDIDTPSLTPRLHSIVAEGRRLMAEKLGIKSSDPNVLYAKYDEAMRSWGQKNTVIRQSEARSLEGRKQSLRNTYQAGVDRVQASPAFQQDMEIVRRAREAIKPLVQKLDQATKALEKAKADTALIDENRKNLGEIQGRKDQAYDVARSQEASIKRNLGPAEAEEYTLVKDSLEKAKKASEQLRQEGEKIQKEIDAIDHALNDSREGRMFTTRSFAASLLEAVNKAVQEGRKNLSPAEMTALQEPYARSENASSNPLKRASDTLESKVQEYFGRTSDSRNSQLDLLQESLRQESPKREELHAKRQALGRNKYNNERALSQTTAEYNNLANHINGLMKKAGATNNQWSKIDLDVAA